MAKKTTAKKSATKSKAGTKKAATREKTGPKAAAKKEESGARKKVAALLIALVIFGFVILAMNISNVAKAGVEKIASKTLGVEVVIGGLDISLQDKFIEASGLKVANPPGYKNAQALTVETISIQADSITKELLSFDSVNVQGTRIYMEVTEKGTNITDLRKNLDRKASEKKSAGEEAVRVAIKQLNIKDAQLIPSSTLSKNKLEPIVLSDIQINGLGARSKGVTPSQAIGVVLDRVATETTRSAAEAGFLRGMNADSLKNIQQSLGLPSGFFDQVKDTVRGIFGD